VRDPWEILERISPVNMVSLGQDIAKDEFHDWRFHLLLAHDMVENEIRRGDYGDHCLYRFLCKISKA